MNPILTGLRLFLADVHGIDRVDLPNRYALRIGPLVVVARSVTPVVKQGSAEADQSALEAVEFVRRPRFRTEVRAHFGSHAVASVVIAGVLHHLNVNIVGVFARNTAVGGLALALV